VLASKEYNLPHSIGFEAKILPNGSLDISDDDIDIADVIGIAEHGSFKDMCRLRDLLYQVIDKYNFLTNGKDVVWVHPGLFFKKHPSLLKDDWYYTLLQYAVSKGIKIERNLKHQLVSSCISTKIGSGNIVIGADAHSIADLDVWYSKSVGESWINQKPEYGTTTVGQ
ncbi:MAG: hypothetical protein WCQ90_14290, partial [Deltaproteobacteria bacterium]